MKKYGLFGYPLEHSYSKKFFTEKFMREDRDDCVFENYESKDIYDLKKIIHENPNLMGLNITLPFKQDVIPMLDQLDDISQKIGAVNTIRILRQDHGKFELHGFNTDAWGFELAIRPILRPHHRRALILGTGGSAKAVSFVFRKLNIEHFFVTREESRFHYSYADLNQNAMKAFQVIVNTTPLGMYPDIDSCPNIPYEFLTHKNLCFDLIYNPAQTKFLERSKEAGAFIHNGFRMLRLQAEKSWEIWNEPVYVQ
ncbi:MAG: shikimate dehydrogenase [Bacteroidetes bacterium]|nr:MAG: shikimate dehydrogenase [Bacteroidota bacterium]REJ99921.1 MAG: shikimate dehydrogenase [Bacteroidota bacterium]REK35899.1 MAG: shikimate dehydrogenase [Bacteroidota bacterium]REK50624.1 MAG: shikimate dehydrogenase [Bacteroidota bacterium]